MDTTPATRPGPLAELQRAARCDTTRDAALLLAGAGVPVFPCRPGDTRPRTTRGTADASTDVDRVASWWARYPTANLGVPTGSSSGVDVVEVTARHGASGYPAIRAARAAGLIDGWAFMVATPAGGAQLYFPHAPRTGQRSWTGIGVQVSFHGEGSHVLVPPSLVLDADNQPATYRPVMTGRYTPGPVDAAALRRLVEPSRPDGFKTAWAAPDASAGPDVLATWVASRPYDGRQRRLSWAAHRLAEHGFDPHSVLRVLGPAAHHTGMDARTIRRTITAAFDPHDPTPSARTTPIPATSLRAHAVTPSTTGRVPAAGHRHHQSEEMSL
ncbi:bifunctional DNA primase/polymerase [Promicromonospora sp. MS192]|uniref:bifunctional DNA primase/polymerase n=1 Tax=Promicromonospora sp. MS192 TaxID=3412684 RepID=UPI003C2C7398